MKFNQSSKNLGDAYKVFRECQAEIDKSFKSLTHNLKNSQEKLLRKFKTVLSD